MPFKSEAQRRKFHAMADSGEISTATLKKWEKETPKGKDLPERVKKAIHEVATRHKTAVVRGVTKQYRRALQLLRGAEPQVFHGTTLGKMRHTLQEGALEPLLAGAVPPSGVRKVYFGAGKPSKGYFRQGQPGLVLPQERALQHQGRVVEVPEVLANQHPGEKWLVTQEAVPLRAKDTLVAAPRDRRMRRMEDLIRQRHLRVIDEEPFYRALRTLKKTSAHIKQSEPGPPPGWSLKEWDKHLQYGYKGNKLPKHMKTAYYLLGNRSALTALGIMTGERR